MEGGILGKLAAEGNRSAGPAGEDPEGNVPCKLNNAKLSERTKKRARWKHRNVMNLSEAEIHSHKGFKSERT